MRWTKSHSTVGVTPLIHCCIPFPDSYSLAWSRGGCISGGPAGWWGRRRSSWNGSCSSTQWLFDCIYQRVPNKTKQLILTFKDVLSGLYNYSLSGHLLTAVLLIKLNDIPCQNKRFSTVLLPRGKTFQELETRRRKAYDQKGDKSNKCDRAILSSWFDSRI